MTNEQIEFEILKLDQLAGQILDAKYKAEKEARHLGNMLDQVNAKVKELFRQFNPPRLEPKC